MRIDRVFVGYTCVTAVCLAAPHWRTILFSLRQTPKCLFLKQPPFSPTSPTRVPNFRLPRRFGCATKCAPFLRELVTPRLSSTPERRPPSESNSPTVEVIVSRFCIYSVRDFSDGGTRRDYRLPVIISSTTAPRQRLSVYGERVNKHTHTHTLYIGIVEYVCRARRGSWCSGGAIVVARLLQMEFLSSTHRRARVMCTPQTSRYTRTRVGRCRRWFWIITRERFRRRPTAPHSPVVHGDPRRCYTHEYVTPYG